MVRAAKADGVAFGATTGDVPASLGAWLRTRCHLPGTGRSGNRAAGDRRLSRRAGACAAALSGARQRALRASRAACASAAEAVELVVVAEFLYYVADLQAALEALWSALEPRGQIAFVHWRHLPHDAFRSGEGMHEEIRGYADDHDSAQLVGHIEPDFRIDIFESLRAPQ